MTRTISVLTLLLALLGAGAPALAAQRTVTLSVELYCASCPYIVKRSLERVAGVTDVAVSYRRQAAVVTFDDSRTSISALVDATAKLGFPSTPVADLPSSAIILDRLGIGDQLAAPSSVK